MTVFSLKETHSGQNLCRFLVSTKSLKASLNQVLRFAAEVVKMIRILVDIYIINSAKKLMMPIFITFVAKTYFVAGFLHNFACFAALRNF